MAEVNEKQILDKLFSAGEEDSVPKRKVTIDRIDLSFLMSGLREGKIEQIEKRFTTKTRVRGEEREKLDSKRFNRALVAEATLAIGDDENVRFDHPQLLSKYKASGAEQVVKKILLAGEVAQLADVVLDLSGYYDQAETDDELKNSLPDED
ncbi:phage tail assembly chaperone [Virgibacillus sp. FSP13]